MNPDFSTLTLQGYTHVPIVREIIADLETPLSTYLKIAQGPYSYLLESVQGGEKWGRYSIIGLPCRTVLRIIGAEMRLEQNGTIIEKTLSSDPLGWIAQIQARYRVPSRAALPRFSGGFVGYFGYELIHYLEPRLVSAHSIAKSDPIGVPDILLMISEELAVFDNLKSKIYLIVHVPLLTNTYDDLTLEKKISNAQHRLDELEARLYQPLIHQEKNCQTIAPIGEDDFHSGFTRADFEAAVTRSKHYIVEGDIMQVVLSQRLSIPFRQAPLDLYRALRWINPSPYLYFFNFDDFYVVGSSPEILTRLQEQIVTVRPIAGTRPRGINDDADQKLEQELLADPKECAEHLMLIDLGRNDVGRVANIGTVQLTEKMVIERYSHVMHIVSNVIGQLRPGLTALDVLRATFPAGTVSGAPKVRAMEIIEELEPVKRGIYAGAVGYLGWTGNMDTAIAIRTAIIKNETLHIQVGAGIVHDSIPAREWEETMNKGRAMFRAVALAQTGFRGRG